MDLMSIMFLIVLALITGGICTVLAVILDRLARVSEWLPILTSIAGLVFCILAVCSLDPQQRVVSWLPTIFFLFGGTGIAFIVTAKIFHHTSHGSGEEMPSG